MQQADGDGLDIHLEQLLHHALDLGHVKRALNPSSGVNPLINLRPQMPLDQRRRLGPADVIETRHPQIADFQYVAKAARRDEPGLGALVLEEGLQNLNRRLVGRPFLAAADFQVGFSYDDPHSQTPLMRQYHGIKQQVPNALLLFRLGDFYELFFDDAVTAARELEITLTARTKKKASPFPCAASPIHAAENYIARLIQKGYRVAICDQMEDASAGQETGQTRGHPHRHPRHRDERRRAALARK